MPKRRAFLTYRFQAARFIPQHVFLRVPGAARVYITTKHHSSPPDPHASSSLVTRYQHVLALHNQIPGPRLAALPSPQQKFPLWALARRHSQTPLADHRITTIQMLEQNPRKICPFDRRPPTGDLVVYSRQNAIPLSLAILVVESKTGLLRLRVHYVCLE